MSTSVMSGQVVVKATFGEEVRRFRIPVSTVTTIDEFSSKLSSFFPQLQAILQQSSDLCIKLLWNDDTVNSTDQLKQIFVGNPERVHFHIRLGASIKEESKTQQTVKVVQVPPRFKSHYLKPGESIPESVRINPDDLPPVITSAKPLSAVNFATASDEWVLLDDSLEDLAAVSLAQTPTNSSQAYAQILSSKLPEPPLDVQGRSRGVISFYLNHQLHTPNMDLLPLDITVAHYVRDVAALTGTKIGCGEGGCGACTVLISYTNPSDQSTVSVPVNACMRPLMAVDGMSVTTIEGVGSSKSGYHPVQSRLAQNAGTQCGYCSPGFAVNAFSMLVNTPKPTQQQVEDQFSGHICRCTGYRPILEAFRSFCVDSQESKHQEEAAKKACCAAKGISCATCTLPCSPAAKSDEVGSSDGHQVAHAVAAWNGNGSLASSVASTLPDMEDLALPFALRRSGQTWAPYPIPAPAISKSKVLPPSSLSSSSGCIMSSVSTFEQHWLENTERELSHLRSLSSQEKPSPRAIRELDSDSESDHTGTSSSSLMMRVSPTGAQAWFQPLTLTDTYSLLNTYAPQTAVRLTVGNTSTGVIKYYPFVSSDSPSVYIDVSRIPEMNKVWIDSFGIHFGAAVKLQHIIEQLNKAIADPTLPSFKTSPFAPLVRHLTLLGNVQVRSAGCWAGNVMIAKTHPDFPSDVVTVFSSYRAMVEWTSASRGNHAFDILTSLQYANSVDEFMLTLHVPFGQQGQLYDSFKIAARHQNSHPIVNAGFNLITDLNNVVLDGTIIYGGLQRGPLQCVNTIAALRGSTLTTDTLQRVLPILQQECTPSPLSDEFSTFVQESPAYRQSLATTMFYRYAVSMWFSQSSLPPRLLSIATPYARPISSGIQVFTSDQNEKPVSLPIPKISGILQTSGEAKYANDQPLLPNSLWAAYVTSTEPAAKLISIDASVALAMPGVTAFLSAKDISSQGGQNSVGMFPGDEELFASTEVGYYGQPIGLIVAESQVIAEAAAKLVTATYDTTGFAPIFSIDQAIAANSFLVDNQYISHMANIIYGDVDKGLANSQVVIKGQLSTGVQTPFYMETQSAVAQIEENDVVRVYSSTQGACDVRTAVATVLGVPAHKVIVDAGRMGGGFGAKLTRGRPIASAAALATMVLRRPVRMQLSRNDDMLIVGKRHPFQIQYTVGANKDGSIQALYLKIYTNGGYCYDTTLGITDMSQLWADNCYFFPNWKSEAYCCKTNLHPFTAMRTPGALQSMTIVEEIIERLAFTLGMPSKAVREKNFYQNGNIAPYGQPLSNVTLQTVWSNLLQQADYDNRLAAVQAFNASSRWLKKGIALTPVKYGFQLPGQQQSAMIQILAPDGTIVLSHSGAEIGQGLTTKVLQCVAYSLGVDLSMIVNRPSSTDKIPNWTMTGGSSTSEAVCQAAMDACAKLNTILDKYRGNGKSWADVVNAAVAGDESLTATCIFSPKADPYPFTYYVWCAACTEVQVDVLSGDTNVLRTDIVYDCGQSLNPIVDIGQIEGAFVQGIGFFLTEETIFDPNTGRVVNNGTWDYKPPASQDIPIDLRVTLLPNLPNSAGILRSKGSGEPPYILAASVKFAVERAVAAARSEIGKTDIVELPVPATIAAIQQACSVDIKQLVV